MLILALDTATDRGSLALVADDRLLREYSLTSPGAYLTSLLPGVEALLADTGRELAELGAIAVSVGPGSFTGLRIGLATAKGLAWALGCPLVPVPTMEALAAQIPSQPHPIGVVMDARRQEVFWGLFRCPEDHPAALSEPIRLPVAALAALVPSPCILTGPGLQVYDGVLRDRMSPDISWAPPDMRYPRAPTVARLARQRLALGLTAPPGQLVPLYLRPAL